MVGWWWQLPLVDCVVKEPRKIVECAMCVVLIRVRVVCVGVWSTHVRRQTRLGHFPISTLASALVLSVVI